MLYSMNHIYTISSNSNTVESHANKGQNIEGTSTFSTPQIQTSASLPKKEIRRDRTRGVCWTVARCSPRTSGQALAAADSMASAKINRYYQYNQNRVKLFEFVVRNNRSNLEGILSKSQLTTSSNPPDRVKSQN